MCSFFLGGGGGDGRGWKEKMKDSRGGKWEGEWGGEIKRRGRGGGGLGREVGRVKEERERGRKF